ncbi:MAG: SH3 domain-containing protein [bacterium]|nr:SH3 domain-containing protein [bacterium]
MTEKKKNGHASGIELIKTTHNGKTIIKQKIRKESSGNWQLLVFVVFVCIVLAGLIIIAPKIGDTTLSAEGSNLVNNPQSLAPASVDITATTPITNMPVQTAYPTEVGVRQMNGTGVVTTSSVKVRLCAGIDCPDIGIINNGDTFMITGRLPDGQEVAGNRLWYQISYFEQVGYVSAAMVGIASEQPVASMGQIIESLAQLVAPVDEPVEAISVAPVWTCVGNLYDCSSFSSREEVMSYFYACPGDPSRMDGDGDGYPCERDF